MAFEARRPGLAVLALALVACVPGTQPPRTLLLLTVDTLRADHLGAYGGQRGLTPHLDALADESQLFEYAYAPAPFTRPSIAALLTGREPARIGMLSNRSMLSESVPTLTGALAHRGWATAAVVSNPVLRHGVGLERHFQVYDDAGAGSTRPGAERDARETTDAALAAVDRLRPNASAGLFLWVHYQDPHGPYRPPAGYRERLLPAEARRPDARRRLPVSRGESGAGGLPAYQVIGDERSPAFYRAGYAGETLYVDEEVGRLLAGLRERGLTERAVIVFASDHGEGLGEDDYWFAHGEKLSEPLVRIPLLIRSPDRAASRRRDVASLVDVAATLVAALGLSPDGAGEGRDLLASDAASHGSEVFLSTLAYVRPTIFGMVSQDFRYVLEPGARSRRERLFRIGEGGRDVAALHPQALARLRARTRGRIREMTSQPGEERGPVGPEERRRLRSLGYLED